MSEQYKAGTLFQQQRERDIYEARAAVVEAAKAVDAERQERHPDLERKACGLEEGHEYWSPSGMMISADTLGPLHAAVARLHELEEQS